MKYISLTRGYKAIIDDEEFEKVNQLKWSFLKHGDLGYGVRSILIGYRDLNKPKGDSRNQIQKMIYMHRFILGINVGAVDHIDGNKLNNQKSNLRIVTKSQNAMNSKVRKDSSSGVTGVGWDKIHSKWRARVKVNGKEVYCRCFDLFEDAVKAREEATTKFHKEFKRF